MTYVYKSSVRNSNALKFLSGSEKTENDITFHYAHVDRKFDTLIRLNFKYKYDGAELDLAFCKKKWIGIMELFLPILRKKPELYLQFYYI